METFCIFVTCTRFVVHHLKIPPLTARQHDFLVIALQLSSRLFVSLSEKCTILDPVKMGSGCGIYPGFNCVNGRQYGSPCTREECESIGMLRNTRKRQTRCDVCVDFEVRFLCRIGGESNNDYCVVASLSRCVSRVLLVIFAATKVNRFLHRHHRLSLPMSCSLIRQTRLYFKFFYDCG